MSSLNDATQTKVDIGIIKAGQTETNRRLSNIEKKMDNFTFVKQDDFTAYKKEADERYATKDEVKPMKSLFWAIIAGSMVGLIGLAFAAIQAKL